MFLGPVEQPCLRFSKQILDDDLSNANRHQVCTFCIAHKKTPIAFSKGQCSTIDNPDAYAMVCIKNVYSR